MRLILHTLTNAYDDGGDYHQFLQSGNQPLLESRAICSDQTLGEFLQGMQGDLYDMEDRHERMFDRVLASGDIHKYLRLAQKKNMLSHPFAEDERQTRFGEWEFDSLEIVPPSLREQQEDLWASAPDFPREDWKAEVANDETHLGFWEWVENEREKASLGSAAPVRLGVGSYGLALANGTPLLVTHPAGDADSVDWPHPDIKNLRAVLYDFREMGLIPNVDRVTLPDGTEFEIEGPYFNEGDEVTVASRQLTGVLEDAEYLGNGRVRVTLCGYELELDESEIRKL